MFIGYMETEQKLIVLTAKKSVLSDKNLLFARLTEVH
jgi:hypothetical protein